jgi:hypothetical protein
MQKIAPRIYQRQCQEQLKLMRALRIFIWRNIRNIVEIFLLWSFGFSRLHLLDLMSGLIEEDFNLEFRNGSNVSKNEPKTKKMFEEDVGWANNLVSRCRKVDTTDPA